MKIKNIRTVVFLLLSSAAMTISVRAGSSQAILPEPEMYIDASGIGQTIPKENIAGVQDSPLEPAAPEATVTISPPAQDTFLSPGLTATGGVTRIWAGKDTIDNPFHSLLQWTNIAGNIPEHASINDTSSSDVQLRLYLADHYGNGTSQSIGLYKLVQFWDEGDADWDYAYSGLSWDTPGGDYDSELIKSITVNTTPGYKTWSSLTLRDLVALWRTCNLNLTDCLLGTYGEYPYGLLLKHTSETADDVKIFVSGEDSTPANRPALLVNYTDSPIALSDQTPVVRRVPSPDYFSIPNQGNYWRAVGMNTALTTPNYSMDLYEGSDYFGWGTSSQEPAGEVDFIAINQTQPDALYPMTYAVNNQTGYYLIEYVKRLAYFGVIHPGDEYGPYSMGANNVVRLWTAYGYAGDHVCLQVEPTPTSGNGLLGAGIIQPEAGREYFTRGSLNAQALGSTGGETLTVHYTFPSTGTYAILVWKEDVLYPTDFYIQGCQDLYLPLTRK